MKAIFTCGYISDILWILIWYSNLGLSEEQGASTFDVCSSCFSYSYYGHFMKPIPHLQTHQSGMIKRNEECVKVSWKAVQSAPAEGVQPSAFQSAICRWAQISPDFGANDIGESQEILYRSRHLKLNTFEEQPSAAKCLLPTANNINPLPFPISGCVWKCGRNYKHL